MYITIKTFFSVEQIRQRLSFSIGKISYDLIGGGYKGDKKFIGNLYHEYFTIRVLVDYSDPFLPIFIGKIVKEKDFTVIKGVFVFHFFSILLVGFFSLFFIVPVVVGEFDFFNVSLSLLFLIFILSSFKRIKKHIKLIKNFLFEITENYRNDV